MRFPITALAIALGLAAVTAPADATFHRGTFNSMRQCDNLLDKWRLHIGTAAVPYFPELLRYFEDAYCTALPDGSFDVVWPNIEDYDFH